MELYLVIPQLFVSYQNSYTLNSAISFYSSPTAPNTFNPTCFHPGAALSSHIIYLVPQTLFSSAFSLRAASEQSLPFKSLIVSKDLHSLWLINPSTYSCFCPFPSQTQKQASINIFECPSDRVWVKTMLSNSKSRKKGQNCSWKRHSEKRSTFLHLIHFWVDFTWWQIRGKSATHHSESQTMYVWLQRQTAGESATRERKVSG